MPKTLTHIVTLSLMLLPAGLPWADVLVLEDGDRISGSLVRVSEGVLVFRTALKGQMMAPMDTVRELATDLPLMITLRDPQADAYGKLATVDGKPHLIPIIGGNPVTIDLARIAEATPIPESAKTEVPPPQVQVGAGVMSRIGEDDTTDLYARIGLNLERPRADIRMDNLIERADSGEFPRYLSSETSFTGRGASPWQPVGQIGLERDRANALDLRTDLTLGVNYQFEQSSTTDSSGLIGLNYAYEDWQHRESAWGRDRTQTDHDVNLKLGLRYTRALSDDIHLNGEVMLLPGLTDFGTVRARSSAYLQKNLTEQLHLRLDLMLNYDSDPAFHGLEPWTAGVGAGIGWQF